MIMRIKVLIVLMCLGFLSGMANADTVLLHESGYFNLDTNGALVGSDLTDPLFDDDSAIANNVALYPLAIPVSGNVTFESFGFGLSGADPYFTLFLGHNPGIDTTATFQGSNYLQAFSTGGDFDLSFSLGVGDYVVAMGVFANMSFAENLGSGTLADGFIGLGESYLLGNYYYELQVTMPDQAQVPEPTTLLLTLLGLVGLAGFRRKSAS
jgi:hypothetical protein